MSNNYFQFKQFRIEQDHCAMKVTTDACIAGAWMNVPDTAQRVLDIGTGTGLLALMLAQKASQISVDGIELDPDAAAQAKVNVAASPWADRVSIIEGDVRDHVFNHKYDIIITNPPFFNNSLLSDKDNKNMARHTQSLSYNDLFEAIDRALNDEGAACVLLPVNEFKIWSSLMKDNGWTCSNQLLVSHKPGAVVKRVVGIFCRNKNAGSNDENLEIYTKKNEYTSRFKELLSPFYLDL